MNHPIEANPCPKETPKRPAINFIDSRCYKCCANINKMSSCIEFCGKAKKKNKRPDGKFQQVRPEISVINNVDKDDEFNKQDVLSKLRYVEIKIDDERFIPPPRGTDVNIDM
jgi:hypothetical protein